MTNVPTEEEPTDAVDVDPAAVVAESLLDDETDQDVAAICEELGIDPDDGSILVSTLIVRGVLALPPNTRLTEAAASRVNLARFADAIPKPTADDDDPERPPAPYPAAGPEPGEGVDPEPERDAP